jgi:hypothetical protein
VANNEIELRTGSELIAVDDSGMAPLAEGLVAAVRGQGVQLTASGGLLTGLTRQVLETALHVEMAEHLGYEHSDPSSHGAAIPATARPVRRSTLTPVMCGSRYPGSGRHGHPGCWSEASEAAGRLRRHRAELVCEGDDDR